MRTKVIPTGYAICDMDNDDNNMRLTIDGEGIVGIEQDDNMLCISDCNVPSLIEVLQKLIDGEPE